MRTQPNERATRIRRISRRTIRTTSHTAQNVAKSAWRESSRAWCFARTFVRDYTALTIVIASAVLVSLLNLRVYATEDSLVARIFGGGEARYVQTAQPLRQSRNLALAPVPVAPVHEPNQKRNHAAALESLEDTTASYGTINGADRINDNGDIKIYTVKNGDTIGQIAQKYGVTIDTILWANEIDDVTRIKPGDTIIILATNGVRHKIAKGDTIASIAKKYKANESAIISYNGLPANGALTVGDEIVVPDGIKEEVVKPQPRIQKRTYTSIATAKQVAVSRSYYGRPTINYRRTQGLHRTNAVDLAAPIGTPTYAAAAGRVIIARYGWNGGYGNYIVIQHPNGTKTLYAHHSKLLVKAGQKVKKGQQIGKVGSTGHSTGPHLHFEVRGARNPF